MTVETKETDLGYRNLLDQIKKIEKEPFVKVGFVKDENHPTDGTSLILIASSQEFGTTKDGIEHVPERSYMRSTADTIKKEVGEMIDAGYEQIIRGQSTVTTVLTRTGEFVQGKIQETITNLDDPPLSEKTISKKGSSNPLIDRGFLRQSVRYQVVEDGRLAS